MDIRRLPLKSAFKKHAARVFPEGVLQFAARIYYARVLRRVTECEETDLSVLRFLVEAGQCAADIGANIGVYSKYLSERVGASGRVISVEPIPFIFDILCSNIRKLGMKNVETDNHAISDREGPVRMRVPQYDSGGENIYEARIVEGEADGTARSFEVPATTVDELLSAAPAVHFIKCDVEGHELSCIRGAARTIARFQPAWLIEISGDMGDERSGSHETRQILGRSGYGAYWFDGAALRPWRPGARSVNYFFLTDTHIVNIRQKGLAVSSSS